MRNFIIWIWFLVPFFLISCATQSGNIVDFAENSMPEWCYSPPQDVSRLYGVGIAYDLEEAKQKAIVHIGQQLHSQVDTLFEENMTLNSNLSENSTVSILETLTDTTVSGAKFMESYQDEEPRYWVLAASPMDCILDVTQSLLLSYELEYTDSHAIVQKLNELLMHQEDYEEPPFIMHDSFLYSVDFSQNIIRDGRFQNIQFFPADTSWTLGGFEGGRTDFHVDDGELWVKNIHPGQKNWSIQLIQENINLKQGNLYVFRFDIRASERREVNVSLNLGEEPWTPYINEYFIVDSEYTTMEFLYFWDKRNTSNKRLDFNMGEHSGDVYLRNVQLLELPPLQQ